MARFLFTTWEGGGNIPPVATAARQLIARNDWSIGNVLLAAMCVVVVFGGLYGLAALLAR